MHRAGFARLCFVGSHEEKKVLLATTEMPHRPLRRMCAEWRSLAGGR